METPITERLENGRVVKFKLSEDVSSVLVEEQCDQCFEERLTKSEFLQLISELNQIAMKMI